MADELTAEQKIEKLQRFKDWVHAYLDDKGIPFHPPGTHGAAGCRIGDRMDYLFAEVERLRAELDAASEHHAAVTKIVLDALGEDDIRQDDRVTDWPLWRDIADSIARIRQQRDAALAAARAAGALPPEEAV